ncbi:hypothetical protein DPX16_5305 [Anabarilius grahami]|uniref:Uncharacterized protein n=1 Tax=Anabarilius grahami TaxID=495550 RepID=A0A3N0XU22_ANAGA|nr:hypothetical protein DPX16_5305 [Anabarilius grahami]
MDILDDMGPPALFSVEKSLTNCVKAGHQRTHILVRSRDNAPPATVEGQNDSFSASSKGFKRYQTRNKSLIYRNDRSFSKKKIQLYILNKHKLTPCTCFRFPYSSKSLRFRSLKLAFWIESADLWTPFQGRFRTPKVVASNYPKKAPSITIVPNGGSSPFLPHLRIPNLHSHVTVGWKKHKETDIK